MLLNRPRKQKPRTIKPPEKRPTILGTETRLLDGNAVSVTICEPYCDEKLHFDSIPERSYGGLNPYVFAREEARRRGRGGCDIEGCLCGKEWDRGKTNGHELARQVMTEVWNAIKKEVPFGECSAGLLGCGIAKLKAHLAKNFEPGMTWDNWGDWHIDHIKPLTAFNLNDNEELEKACHYSNLQPLWARDNLRKSDQWAV